MNANHIFHRKRERNRKRQRDKEDKEINRKEHSREKDRLQNIKTECQSHISQKPLADPILARLRFYWLKYKLSNAKGKSANSLYFEMLEAELDLGRVRHTEILLQSLPQLVIQCNIVFPCLLHYFNTSGDQLSFFTFFEKDLTTFASIVTSAFSLFSNTSKRSFNFHNCSLSSCGIRILFLSTVFYGTSLLLLQAVVVYYWSFHRIVLYVFLFFFSCFIFLCLFEMCRTVLASKFAMCLSSRELKEIGDNYSSLVNFDKIKNDIIYVNRIQCCFKRDQAKNIYWKINKLVVSFVLRIIFYFSLFIGILITIFVQVGTVNTISMVGLVALSLFMISVFLKIFFFKCFRLWKDVDETIRQAKENQNIFKNELEIVSNEELLITFSS